MPIATIHSAREAVEILISAVSVLGGFMAFASGLEASDATFAGRRPDEIAYQVDKGLAYGFNLGLPAMLIVCTVLV